MPVTVTEETPITFTVMLAFMLLSFAAVAVMVTVPCLRPLTVPFVTVATELSEDVHKTFAAAEDGVTETVKAALSPTATVVSVSPKEMLSTSVPS